MEESASPVWKIRPNIPKGRPAYWGKPERPSAATEGGAASPAPVKEGRLVTAAGGGRDDQAPPSDPLRSTRVGDHLEPEYRRQRSHTLDSYRVKVPLRLLNRRDNGCDLPVDVGWSHRVSPIYPGRPACSRATVGPALGSNQYERRPCSGSGDRSGAGPDGCHVAVQPKPSSAWLPMTRA
jgi:hypothetical protein